jgi:chemotaxis protein methyltransferase CheR
MDDAVIAKLTRASAIPLGAYRRQHLERCVARALERMGDQEPHALAERLRRDDAARAWFRRAVLTSCTSVFRDPEAFQELEQIALASLRRRERLNVWSAGCASGEELRSVAELLDRHGLLGGSRLIGTDVLEDALAGASTANSRVDGRLVMRFEHRDLVLDDPPPGTFDLILCRNVAIYFEPQIQREVQRKLVSVLRPGGFVMLGRTERWLRPDTLGLTMAARHLYRKEPA